MTFVTSACFWSSGAFQILSITVASEQQPSTAREPR